MQLVGPRPHKPDVVKSGKAKHITHAWPEEAGGRMRHRGRTFVQVYTSVALHRRDHISSTPRGPANISDSSAKHEYSTCLRHLEQVTQRLGFP